MLPELTTFLILIISILFYLHRKNKYWENKNVPYPQPSLLLGNYSDYILLKKNIGEVAGNICRSFPDVPMVGTLFGTEPALLIKDPELVRLIMAKDFYYFSAREVSNYTQKETFTRNMFSESGDYWKVVRQNLTPIFSSSKMKNMFPIIRRCSENMEQLLKNNLKHETLHETRKMMGRYTLDCIGSCAFGLDTNVIADNSNKNPFNNVAKKLLDFNTSKMFKFIVRSIWPKIFYGLGFKVMSDDGVEFFQNLLLEVFKERQSELDTKHDLLGLVLKFKKNNDIVGDALSNMKTSGEKKKVHLKVDDDFLVAQCMLFFTAGFETTAATLSFTLYELAKSENNLNRAIDEIDNYLRKNNGQIDYNCTTDLPFLEACVDETLRLYPVLSVLTRETVEEYIFSSGLSLSKGMRVHIPIIYFHKNPDYFPEPEQFRPDRFMPEERRNIKPYTYFPFGEGPRICIGMRFAKMVMMTALVSILKDYKVTLADEMPNKIELEPRYPVTQSKSGIYVKFLPRSISVK